MTIKGLRSQTSTVITARSDLRTVATIARFYQENGITMNSIGNVIASSVEDFCNILEKNFNVSKFESISVAKEYLSTIALRPTHKKGEHTLFNALSKESLEIEIASSPDLITPVQPKSKRAQLLEELNG